MKCSYFSRHLLLKQSQRSKNGLIKFTRARRFGSGSGSRHRRHIIDLRSDTVTLPSKGMLQAAMSAKLGDDVYLEDPTVIELEEYAADLFGKEKGLFLPTCTMSNLVSVLSHCHTRASEILIGASSHICMWEGGNAASLGGVHTLQIEEDPMDATMDIEKIRDSIKDDSDDHWPETKLLCLENTHNMLGGVALPKEYMDKMGTLAREEWNIACHLDGARIFNTAVALYGNAPNAASHMSDLCRQIDTISICCSKGLGAPLGSVLVGESEFIRLARRARKRCGGGMRQAGVVASMSLYAMQHNVAFLEEDHYRAKRIGKALHEHGFYLPRNGQVDTNVVYFGLPLHLEGGDKLTIPKDEFARILEEDFGIRITGGYSKGGELFRIVTHMGITDDDVGHAIDTILKLCS